MIDCQFPLSSYENRINNQKNCLALCCIYLDTFRLVLIKHQIINEFNVNMNT